MTRLPLFFALLFVSPAFATDPPTPPATAASLTVPPTLAAKDDSPIVLTVTTTGKAINWLIPPRVGVADPGGNKVYPPTDATQMIRVNGKTIYLWAAPGTYTLRAHLGIVDDVLTGNCVLTVAGAPVPPPVPVPPTINVALTNTSGKVGTPVTIIGTALDKTSAVAFNGTASLYTIVSPTQVETRVPVGATSGALTVTTPAGAASVPFVVGETPPIPPPNPPPGPVTKIAWAIVIEETANRTVETARVVMDTAGWNALGVKWRHYDKDSPYAATPSSQAAVAAAGGLPALILIDDKGKVVRSVKLPATMDGVKTEVSK